MQKILIPVDGSENALRAVQQAIAVAKSSPDVALHLLYVQDPIPPHLHDKFSVDSIKKAEAKVTDRIVQAAKQLCDDAATSCTVHIRVGAVAQTIVACADELQCNAIIMGTRGMNAIASLIVGSVTTKVIHLAHVPVTLVK